MSNELKERYSDEDLQEFKTLILGKISSGQEELDFTNQQIRELSENGFNQQGGDWYDDTSTHTDLEMLQRMAQRQAQHLQNLKNALLRIQNKTYGICAVTGRLIDKNRLLAVPHATKSVEGKKLDHKSAPQSSAGGNPDNFDAFAGIDGPPSPVSPDPKIRITKKVERQGKSSDDWDGPDGDTIEDAGYRKKYDDE